MNLSSQLVVELLGKDSLSRIGSTIGRPIYADECTPVVNQISYATFIIEVDATHVLSGHMKVQELNGNIFEQETEFD